VSSKIHRLAFLLGAVCLSSLGPTLQAQSPAEWISVNEGKISVYTQGDPADARALLRTFAGLRTALSQASPLHETQTTLLKIIVFPSEKQFNQYRLNAGSCAFYQQTHKGEYVALADLLPEHREVTAHEFTHFVIAHTGLKIPLWLNEGLADFYSTFRESGETVTFGRPVPGRLHVLRRYDWLPLNALFDVSAGSSYYSEPSRMALFYSESWALTHMLVVSPQYGGHFPEFLRALSDGHNTPESLQLAYGKTPAQVEADLREYLDTQHLPVIQAHLTGGDDAPMDVLVQSIPNSEMDLHLADLAVANPNTQAAAEMSLRGDSTGQPDNAAEEESLGYLALRQGQTDRARSHFRLAVDRHSTDPNVWFYLAHLDHAAGAPTTEVIPLLQRALALKPDLSDARLELALIATNDGQFNQALEALKDLSELRPEFAYAAAYTKAYCLSQTEQFKAARSAAEYAKTLIQNDHDRAQIADLLSYIDGQSE
jgi:tetratricopeptide (TPR) repeat protein